MTTYYFCMYFFVYGFLGWCTEVAYAAVKQKKFVNRGFLNGPICPIYGLGVGMVVQFMGPYKSNLVMLYVVSVIMVTTLEWITGFILEKVFHNKWWDYSNMPLNLNGYVCLLFSLVWGIACVAIVKWIHPFIHRLISYVPVTLGIIILIIMGIGVFADLYVTASGIFKVNKRLASMEKIAGELREISNSIGENIYRGVVEAMEMQAEVKEKIDISDELGERIRELKSSYNELASRRSVMYKRLMKAYPKMKTKKYKDAWEDLRHRWKFK